MRALPLILAIMALFVLGITSAFAQTFVPAGAASGHWTKAGNPYIISAGDVSVPVNQSLLIDPGVVVQIDKGLNFTVYGTLTAIGTPTDSVFFTSDQPSNPTIGWWESITVYNTATFAYISVRYGDNAIQSGNTSAVVTINNSLFEKNYNALILNGNLANIRASVFQYNTDWTLALGSGAMADSVLIINNNGGLTDIPNVGGIGTLTNSTISNNTWGVQLDDGGNYTLKNCLITNCIHAVYFTYNTSQYSSLELDSCNIMKSGSNGVDGETGNYYTYPTLTLNGTTISQSNGSGIYFSYYFSSLTIINSTISQNGKNPPQSLDRFESGVYYSNDGDHPVTISGSIISNNQSYGVWGYSSNCTVNGCMITSNGKDGLNVNVSSTFSMFGSTVNNNSGNGITASNGINMDSCLVQGNNQIGINMSTSYGTTVRRSVITHNGNAGIANIGANSLLENNTIALNGSGISNITSNSNVLIHNNIIYANSGNGIQTTASPVPATRFNLVYGNINNTSAANYNGYPIVYGLDTIGYHNKNGFKCDPLSNLNTDPKLNTTDFSLLGSSPCINAGDTVSPRKPDSSYIDIGASPFIVSGTISLSASSVMFDTTLIGKSEGKSVKVKNTGSSQLLVYGTNTNGKNFTTASVTKTVNPGDSLTLSVIFSPTGTGIETDSLIIQNSSTNSRQYIVSLKGVGRGYPKLVVNKPSDNIGSVALGSSRKDSIQFSNSGNGNLIASLQISGGDSTSFSIYSGSSFNIAPAQAQWVTLTFNPVSLGIKSSSLIVTSNDTLTPRLTIPISGTTQLASIITFTTSLEYGSVAVNTSPSQAVRMTDTTAGIALVLDTIFTNTTNYAVNKTSASVNKGDTLTVSVSFKPQTFGSFSDTLYIGTNTATRFIKVPLHGTSPYPTIALQPTSVNFGTAAPGDTIISMVKVVQSTVNVLKIDSLYTKTTLFAVTKTSLNVTDSGFISIKYIPPMYGSSVDTLYVHCNAQQSLYTIPLKGNAPYPITFTGGTLQFSQVAVGDSTTSIVLLGSSFINGLTNLDSIYTRTSTFRVSPSSATLHASDTLHLHITFAPSTFGVFSDSVIIRNKTQNASIYIALSGTSPYPVIVSNVTSLDFGSVDVNINAVKPVIIKNTSLNDLHIDSLYFQTHAFMISDSSLNHLLHRGDSIVVHVKMLTGTAGKYSDTLLIRNNSQQSIFKIALTGSTITVVQNSSNGLPTSYSLSQNYPNPFNPSTMISYQLPRSSTVTLKVYDIIGREVSTLVNEQENAGQYEVTFDASRLASGVYFYHLQAGSFTDTKKLLLLK